MDIPLSHGHASVAQTQKDCNDCQISLHEHFVLQHLNQSIIYLVRKANKGISVLAEFSNQVAYGNHFPSSATAKHVAVNTLSMRQHKNLSGKLQQYYNYPK